MKIIMSIWFFVRRCWIWIKMLWSEFYVHAFVLGALVLVYFFITKDIFLSTVIINPIFIIIAGISVLIKNNNHKFNLWLEKRIKH